jgi:hypothetical protein
MGSETNRDNRVKNLQVAGDEQSVDEVVATFDAWLPLVD